MFRYFFTLLLLTGCPNNSDDALTDSGFNDSGINDAVIEQDIRFDMNPMDSNIMHQPDSTLDLIFLDTNDSFDQSPHIVDTINNQSSLGITNPEKAINGIGGTNDVASLGYQDNNCCLILSFINQVIHDGPGIDFVVFENGFRIGQTNMYFMDPIVVEVSNDGAGWVKFPHQYLAEDQTNFSSILNDWIGFAGIHPTLYISDAEADPFDQTLSGGDGFDISTLPANDIGNHIRQYGVRYIRLSAASRHINPITNMSFPSHPISNGPDIDGIIARYLRESN